MFRSATHICDPNDLLGGTALVQKMFSRSTDDIPDGYRRRTQQELEKLYENKASFRHGGADFFGLRHGFVGDVENRNAGMQRCVADALHPHDFDASLQRTAEPPLIFILRRDEWIGR